ncbi:Serine carboxypeptidase-like [Glycine max]|nr:Serine carboxypeptidase-like [Glycine max]
MACDKVDVTYENWKEVPTAQKDLIWEDIKAEFDIPEAFDSRMKRKLLQTVGERWKQFKSDLTRKWALAADQDGVEDTVCEKYNISKEKWAQFCQTCRDPSWEKLLAEKTKKKLEEAVQSGSVDGVIDPPSPVRRHVKWKMARTKKIGEMTTEAAKEITEKIDSFEEQATQGSFIPHGRQDVLTAAIGRLEHPGRVRAAGAGVTIKQYFGSAPRTSRSSSKVTRQLMASFSQMQSQIQSQMQSQGLAPPPEPLVGPFGSRVSTKGSCVDPLGNDPETGDSDRCGLYIEVDPARLVAMGRVYEGSTVVHNTPLLPGQVKVSVEEVTDADAPVPVPTNEVVVSPVKPPPKPDPEVDDPLYLMTLTIPELFLRPYQVIWDATVFKSIQRYGQSQFESESYIKTWMQSSKCNVYLGAYLNGGHWQMVVILPKEHLVVWFCSLHNRPDNYLKGIINSALKGLDDAPQPKSKAPARWIVVKVHDVGHMVPMDQPKVALKMLKKWINGTLAKSRAHKEKLFADM